MEDTLKKGFEFITDLSKQLISLSTGILALSITFAREIIIDKNKRRVNALALSWLFYLISICFGVWTMMAVTGTIISPDFAGTKTSEAFNFNLRFPSGLQILSFLTGTILLVIFGIRAVKSPK
jgi:hypothetical protein